MDTQTKIIWTVHPDGLHIHVEGRLVGVIPVSEGIHLMQQLADCVRHWMDEQKTPQPD